MNREMKHFKGQLPIRIDSFIQDIEDGSYFAEYDGFHFEAKTNKALINQILRYIFNGGQDK